MAGSDVPPRSLRGDLRDALAGAIARGRRTGALVSLSTRTEIVPDEGVAFVVHVLENLARKDHARTAPAAGASRNPFLPYDPDLFVADLSGTHVALLNKFNVVDEHLLIVTREYEDQQAPLTRPDLEALWVCLGSLGGLAFYNSGAEAGASQPHKHLQLVLGSLGGDGGISPLDARLRKALRPEGIGRADLPFEHALAALADADDATRAAATSHRTLEELLEAAGIRSASAPYNLLMTRRWMMVVSRSRESFGAISVNALGFAGSLLARDDDELRTLADAGPMNVLRSVGMAIDGARPARGDG